MKNKLVGRKVLQPIFERLYRICLRGMNYGTAGYVNSSGEIYVMKLLNDLFGNTNSIIAFDVGANDGDYAKAFCDNVSIHYELHCFEPAKHPFKSLKQYFEGNDQVILNNFALGQDDSKLDLYYDREGTGWASFFQIEHDSINVKFDNTEKVDVVRAVKYCKDKNIDHIHFLKMDVEGYELNVLKGVLEFLREDKIDVIQFEFGIANLVSKVLLRDFFSILKGFKIYRILKDGLQEITYNERYEIFLTSNYLAIRNDLM